MERHCGEDLRDSARPETELFGVSSLDASIVARADTCVLLTGDRSAAEGLAHRIHRTSRRSDSPFILIDCAASEETVRHQLLLALPAFEGTADAILPHDPETPTVFLREVGRLGPELQRTLARQLVEVRRKGRGDRRVIASTSEPLLRRVDDGTFDDALFYRLNAIHVMVNPQDA